MGEVQCALSVLSDQLNGIRRRAAIVYQCDGYEEWSSTESSHTVYSDPAFFTLVCSLNYARSNMLLIILIRRISAAFDHGVGCAVGMIEEIIYYS